MIINGQPYPLTLISDRYQGCYSGGRWLAFNEYLDAVYHAVGFGFEDDDVTCSEFWADPQPIGVGDTPDEAIQMLVELIEDGCTCPNVHVGMKAVGKELSPNCPVHNDPF